MGYFNQEYFFEKDGNFEYYFDGSIAENLVICLNTNVDKKSITELTIPSRYKGHKVKYVGNFSNCQSLKKVVFQDGIEFICNSAFADCISLLEVVIPESVSCIEEDAFKNCTELLHINVSPKAALEIKTHAFFNCKSLESSIIPKSNIRIKHSGAFKNTKSNPVKPSEVLFACIGLTIYLMPFIIFIIVIIYGISLVTGSTFGGGNSSDGNSISGYCQFDGCNRKAVGPTYEFCSRHKNALDYIWDNEYK